MSIEQILGKIGRHAKKAAPVTSSSQIPVAETIPALTTSKKTAPVKDLIADTSQKSTNPISAAAIKTVVGFDFADDQKQEILTNRQSGASLANLFEELTKLEEEAKISENNNSTSGSPIKESSPVKKSSKLSEKSSHLELYPFGDVNYNRAENSLSHSPEKEEDSKNKNAPHAPTESFHATITARFAKIEKMKKLSSTAQPTQFGENFKTHHGFETSTFSGSETSTKTNSAATRSNLTSTFSLSSIKDQIAPKANGDITLQGRICKI